MEWIEVTARSIDEAKELALDRLGVVESELEFEVLEEPRKGFLARLGRSEARIRARVKPVSREKPGDRRQRRGRRPNERPNRSEGGARKSSPVGDGDAGDGSPAPARDGARRSSRSRGRGRGGTTKPSTSSRSAETTKNAETTTEADAVSEATLSIEEQAAAAAKFTEELVGNFGLTAQVSSRVVEDDIEVNVEGDGLGVLVGPRGVTLQALEELTRAVLQHVAGGHSARLHLDVSGYRERRRTALAEFAVGIAGEVAASGEERSLEPMHAPDRKVVHDAVADVDGVSTTSEGEDPRRRVVIRPA
ncbi:MAG: RNA-binding cell elongation regulator Jag/EloR [Actinomycetota bacterium]|nr:RNA-binding cell elongation regulator Jag/EloR [Actinomycetota bacterium]